MPDHGAMTPIDGDAESKLRCIEILRCIAALDVGTMSEVTATMAFSNPSYVWTMGYGSQ